jgi:ribonucleoside-diphosphate reductase alpha chain
MEKDIDAQVAAAKFVDDDNSTMPQAQPVPARASVVVSDGPGTAAAAATTAAEASLGDLMGDAPACSTCGHMTVRSGSCYVCLTCGDTTGCS